MKSRFSEALNHINEKYIQEMVTGSRVRPVARWVAMAACLAVFFFGGICVGFWNNGQNPDDMTGMPPCRIGLHESEMSMSYKYSLQSAWEQSSAVALIRIGNWLEEENFVTYFEAEVIQCYKGNLQDRFILKQDGWSKSTMKGYPLFTKGNEILVFLADSTMGLYTDNCYWILGSWTTVFGAVRDNDGNMYLVDTMDFMREAVNEIQMNCNISEDLRLELKTNYFLDDPIRETDIFDYDGRMFLSLSSFEEVVDRIVTE